MRHTNKRILSGGRCLDEFAVNPEAEARRLAILDRQSKYFSSSRNIAAVVFSQAFEAHPHDDDIVTIRLKRAGINIYIGMGRHPSSGNALSHRKMFVQL
jgi:hypothetical protein